MKELHIKPALKHETLKHIILQAISCGELKPGEQLPSQNALAEIYGLSPSTVREGLASLVHQGLLYRIQGKGTFVSERQLSRATIAICAPHLCEGVAQRYSADVNPLIIQAAEDEARRSGAGIMLYMSNDDVDTESANLLDAMARKVDALVLLCIGGSDMTDRLRELLDAGIRIVMMDRTVDGLELDHVVTDNFSGAQGAVNALVRAGFRDIYHITVINDWSSVRDRLAGYGAAMRQNGLPERVSTVGGKLMTVPQAEAEVCEQVMLMLAEAHRPFAVFALNATILQGIWKAIETTGIPHDQIGLACFDEPYPPIPDDVFFVRVTQPLEEMARTSIRMAMADREGDMTARAVVLEPLVQVVNNPERIIAHIAE